MPRIELLPPELPRHEPSPTIDVCEDCASDFVEREPLPSTVVSTYFQDHTVGSTDVAHPPYEDEFYACFVCGAILQDFD